MYIMGSSLSKRDVRPKEICKALSKSQFSIRLSLLVIRMEKKGKE